MSGDIVKIKGSTSGLMLTFDENASYEAVKTELAQKLGEGSKFFLKGAIVSLPQVFSAAEREELKKILESYGLICYESDAKDVLPSEKVRLEREQAQERAAQAATEQQNKVEEMVVVNRTLRGGQEVRTQSSVLVCGNVNPGAQIIAGGNIDIRGTCRGVVHAGAFGNSQAFVIADHLIPTQIRIANLIARSPDVIEKDERAMRAKIENGRIVVEPIER